MACGHFGPTFIAALLLCLYVLSISVPVFGRAHETLDECLKYSYIKRSAAWSSIIDVSVPLAVRRLLRPWYDASVAEGGDGQHTWKAMANLSKQWQRTAESGWDFHFDCWARDKVEEMMQVG